MSGRGSRHFRRHKGRCRGRHLCRRSTGCKRWLIGGRRQRGRDLSRILSRVRGWDLGRHLCRRWTRHRSRWSGRSGSRRGCGEICRIRCWGTCWTWGWNWSRKRCWKHQLLPARVRKSILDRRDRVLAGMLTAAEDLLHEQAPDWIPGDRIEAIRQHRPLKLIPKQD